MAIAYFHSLSMMLRGTLERYDIMKEKYERMESEFYRVQANINLDAICHNIAEAKKLLKEGTKIMAVIKADGYGHGAIQIARTLNSMVDAYGIAIIEEGISLRKEGITKPLLILGFTPKELYSSLVEYDIMQTVFEYDMAYHIAQEAQKQGKVAKIHIKIDTGMNRIGFALNQKSIDDIIRISKLDNLVIDGIYSHFAGADEADKTSANNQYQKYEEFLNRLKINGVHIPMKHLSNSAGIIDLPEAHYDMVRSGIITYGLYPSEEVNKAKIALEPAMELKTHVVYVKEVAKGEGISYNSTFITDRVTKVATIPVGYGDGYPRQLSSKGRVLIHGKSAPIIGKICMDQFMVDVTDIPNVEQGDIVTLIGRDGADMITVGEVANLAGSFHYEFICNIGKRIPRLYYKDSKLVNSSNFYQY